MQAEALVRGIYAIAGRIIRRNTDSEIRTSCAGDAWHYGSCSPEPRRVPMLD